MQLACTPSSTDALIWWAVSTAVARAAAMRDGGSSSAPCVAAAARARATREGEEDSSAPCLVKVGARASVGWGHR